MQITRKKSVFILFGLLILISCGSVAEFKVTPITKETEAHFLKIEVTNKFLRGKFNFHYISIYSIKVPLKEFETYLSKDSDRLSDYLFEIVSDHHRTGNKNRINLIRNLIAIPGTDSVDGISLNGSNPNFYDNFLFVNTTFVDGLYFMESASNAIWSMGYDKQIIVFKLFRGQITILFTNASGAM